MAVTKRALTGRGFLKIEVAEQGPTPRRMRKAQNAANKQTWKDVGIFHHVEHIPKRFTQEGARELGFRARTPKYVAKKKKQKGHNLPNVWSGESERRAKRVRMSATSKQVRLRYNVPALNFHSGHKELRRSNTQEAEAIAKEFASRYEENLERETS